MYTIKVDVFFLNIYPISTRTTYLRRPWLGPPEPAPWRSPSLCHPGTSWPACPFLDAEKSGNIVGLLKLIIISVLGEFTN